MFSKGWADIKTSADATSNSIDARDRFECEGRDGQPITDGTGRVQEEPCEDTEDAVWKIGEYDALTIGPALPADR